MFDSKHNKDINDKIKYDFLNDITRKAKLKQIDRTVEEIMNQRNFLLFERRKKFEIIILISLKIF